MSGASIQFKGKGYHDVRVKTEKGEKCLLIGTAGMSKSNSQSLDIYEFSLKEEKIVKSGLKINASRVV